MNEPVEMPTPVHQHDRGRCDSRDHVPNGQDEAWLYSICIGNPESCNEQCHGPVRVVHECAICVSRRARRETTTVSDGRRAA